ncbi:restriction endonuclease [Achromobacter xylosoxidans]
MRPPRKLPNDFEQLIADIFARLGGENIVLNQIYHGSLDHDYEIDILFGKPGDVTIVEVKAYRFRSPPAPEVFAGALRKMAILQQEARARRAMVAMSCPLTDALSAVLQRYPTVEVWDAKDLLKAASPFPDLLSRLETILEVDASDVLGSESFLLTAPLGEGDEQRGSRISQELHAIEPGRAGASLFEQKCTEALRYLFERDLVGWHEQHSTEDGLHRRDLVCRIVPHAEFWQLMLGDLKSRYVVFEFKNYSEPITQSEVITTERYLYPGALRSLAIIISPKGCSDSAMKVMQGAMREQGKLLLSLTVEDLGVLLIGKDQGSDPNTFLFDRVDAFLLGLGR